MQYRVIKDLTQTSVYKNGIDVGSITIPAKTVCDVTDTIMSRMGGKTDIVSCTVDGVFYDNISFPTSWSKKDEFPDDDGGEGPYIKLLPDNPVPDGGRKRYTKKRHTKKRHTKKYKKNKKTKRFRRRN
jgi:hypothetical protein